MDCSSHSPETNYIVQAWDEMERCLNNRRHTPKRPCGTRTAVNSGGEWKPQYAIRRLTVVFLVVVSCADQQTTGQTTACIAPPPCSCTESTVMCSDDGLDEVPEFDVTDQIFDVLFIQLDGNNISKVPKIAFSNLTRTNCSDIRIDISSNEITSIDDTAFENIEEDVTELQLENNNLTSLPSALGNLRMLKSLSIYGNKIKYFDTYTLQKLGPSLVTLRVGVSDGGIWPKGFRYLFELADLTIRDAPTTSLPFDAFLGFEAKLNSLQIENTDLLMVPTALCNLKYLNALSFSNNSKLVDGKNIFPMCRPALTSVRTVIVSYNSLTGFPVLLNSFPNVTTIRFTNNPDLKYIEESDITTDSILSNLDLSDNGFTQIPEALQRLVHLQRLDLSNNNIITLEDLSVRNMPGLVWISLDRNPLSYISDTAFKNMSSLQTLMLENVQMTVLPRAVLTLPSLNYISLRGTQVLCSCEMKWILTDWKRWDEVTIDGTCGSSELDIKTYITKYLPDCP